MKIIRSDHKCKFSLKPKYEVQLEQPNPFNLDWVYSVPCGEPGCESWVFIDTSAKPDWGPDGKVWLAQYLEQIGWATISNQANKRFQCPNCCRGSVVCI